MIRTYKRVEENGEVKFVVWPRVPLENDLGPIDLTGDEHILRNLDYANPKLSVEY